VRGKKSDEKNKGTGRQENAKPENTHFKKKKKKLQTRELQWQGGLAKLRIGLQVEVATLKGKQTRKGSGACSIEGAWGGKSQIRPKKYRVLPQCNTAGRRKNNLRKAVCSKKGAIINNWGKTESG